MSNVGASVDGTHDRYYHFFGSVVCGLKRYARQMQTSVGDVNITYFNNLYWDGQKLVEVDKPNSANGFSNYESYKAFLDDAMTRITANLVSEDRAHPFEMLGT